MPLGGNWLPTSGRVAVTLCRIRPFIPRDIDIPICGIGQCGVQCANYALSFPAASWTFVREIEEEEEKSSPFAFLTLVPRQAYGPTATDECLTAVFVLLGDGRL